MKNNQKMRNKKENGVTASPLHDPLFFKVVLLLWSLNHPRFAWQMAQIASFHLFTAFLFVLPQSSCSESKHLRLDCPKHFLSPLLATIKNSLCKRAKSFKKKFPEPFSSSLIETNEIHKDWCSRHSINQMYFSFYQHNIFQLCSHNWKWFF